MLTFRVPAYAGTNLEYLHINIKDPERGKELALSFLQEDTEVIFWRDSDNYLLTGNGEKVNILSMVNLAGLA